MYVLLKNNMRIFNSCLKLICYSTQIQKRPTVNKEKHQSGDLKQLKDQFQCNDFAVNPALICNILHIIYLCFFAHITAVVLYIQFNTEKDGHHGVKLHRHQINDAVLFFSDLHSVSSEECTA